MFCILLALGFWQLDRADEKKREQQEIEARRSAKPVAVEEVLESPSASHNFQRVYLHGSYMPERSIFLVNRFYLGQPGYEVLTPFRLKSTDQIIIVSRGWTVLGPDRNALPELDTPGGELHVVGAIHVPTGRSFFEDEPVPDGVWPLRLHHLNIEKIDRFFVPAVFPYVVRLDETMPGVLYRHWPVPNMNPERSTSYAIQWFAMAFLLMLIALMNLIRAGHLFRSKGQ